MPFLGQFATLGASSVRGGCYYGFAVELADVFATTILDEQFIREVTVVLKDILV